MKSQFFCLFIAQFCEPPPQVSNAIIAIYTDNVNTSTLPANTSLWANTTYINYTCDGGFYHHNGSLSAICSCDSFSSDMCTSEPYWVFDFDLPTCDSK